MITFIRIFSLLLCLISILSPYQIKAQTTLPNFTFEVERDTTYPIINEISTFSFKVKVPKQASFEGFEAEFFLMDSDFQIDKKQIFFSADKRIKISGTKDQTKSFSFQYKVTNPDIKVMKIGLRGFDKKGKSTKIQKSFSTLSVLVFPKNKDLVEKEGYEFWLFTGTNLDLLDGAKPKDLYFKASYLLNIEKQKKGKPLGTSSWLYFTFGKNRFFSAKDSIRRISFSDKVFETRMDDSVRVIDGFYNANRQTITNNIFLSSNYYYNLKNISSKKSKVLIGVGFYFSLQDITTKVGSTNLIFRDTSTVISSDPRAKSFQPIVTEFRRKEFNNNVNISFLHILNTKNVNIKTQLSTGWHWLNYPFYSRSNGLTDTTFYRSSDNLFLQFRIDATAINPGISLGFESLLRAGSIPLFNVSITKVLDIEKVKSIFSPLAAATGK